MSEDIQARASEATREGGEPAAETQVVQQSAARFPEEAFPCPHCGQMLGPGVRVCAACRQPIDASQIRIAVAAPAVAPSQAAAVPRARFSWGIFLAALLAGLVLVMCVIQIAGFEKGQYVIVAAQLILATWVFSDARQKGFPRPFRWGAGTLLFWIVFLPWYLGRRRQPEARCPMVESGIGPFLLILGCCFAVALLMLSAIATHLPNLPK